MGSRNLILALFFTTVACLPQLAQGQVTMTLQVPPGGVLLKKQLWNMALVYTGSNPLGVQINMVLSPATGGQPVMTAVTSPLILSRGATQVLAATVSPIQYQYLSSALPDEDPDGYLPVGAYQACYSVQLEDEQHTPLVEDCITFEVEPLSPPVLNTPTDGDTLFTTLPQFTWLPPAPVNLFNSLSYRFNLVEVLPGQEPTDAMAQNLPVYTNQNWPDVFMNYPAGALTLDTGKQYAWQVVAQNNLQPSVQSEIWTFRVRGFGDSTPPFKGNYIPLAAAGQKEGIYPVENGVIGIKYYSFDKEHFANVNFLGPGQQLLATYYTDVKYGDNYLVYNLGGGFQQGKIYYVQVADSGNNIYEASFRLTK